MKIEKILKLAGTGLGERRNSIRRMGLIGCLAIATYGIANGIPAKPGLIKAAQPDGTEVIVSLQGDASGKYAFSEDGYPLAVDNQGFYVFMAQTEDGTPIASTNREINISQRSPATISFLSGIDANSLKLKLFSERNTRRNARKGPGLWDTTFPHEGEQKGVVILVEFDDMEFRIENPKEYYYNMLNQEGFSENGSTGSARDYFMENSGGKFIPEFDVYGPIKLHGSYSYYGRNNSWGDDAGAVEMVLEACTLLSEEIDFTLYDRNYDGEIDNVYIFYAGFGEADGGGSNTIWPHSSDIVKATGNRNYFDGKVINHYACSNEIQYTTRMPDGIGTFCHEFGHVLGLPDLYSTMFAAFTPGYWDIMAFGSYNNQSRTPPYYSSYERYALDWMEPETLTGGEHELVALGESNHAYLIPTEKEDEFYLLENRQLEGWDSYLPWHGMLVWHIDYRKNVWDGNMVNSFTDHQYVDIVEADNDKSDKSVPGDVFPGTSKKTEFSSTTKPALVSWAGEELGYRIYNISESEDGLISFIVEGGESNGIETVVADSDLVKIIGRTIRLNKEGVSVYDLTGRRINIKSLHSEELPSGTYIATDGKQTRKFIIL